MIKSSLVTFKKGTYSLEWWELKWVGEEEVEADLSFKIFGHKGWGHKIWALQLTRTQLQHLFFKIISLILVISKENHSFGLGFTFIVLELIFHSQSQNLAWFTVFFLSLIIKKYHTNPSYGTFYRIIDL